MRLHGSIKEAENKVRVKDEAIRNAEKRILGAKEEIAKTAD